MKTTRRAANRAGVAIVAMALCSCIPPLKLGIYNNTADRIDVRWAPTYAFGPKKPKPIAAGASRVVDPFDMLPPGLVIEVGGCTVGYQLPPVDKAYPYRVGGPDVLLNIQVEPDLSIVLLPADAGPRPMPQAKNLPLQKRYGYPVRPLYREC